MSDPGWQGASSASSPGSTFHPGYYDPLIQPSRLSYPRCPYNSGVAYSPGVWGRGSSRRRRGERRSKKIRRRRTAHNIVPHAYCSIDGWRDSANFFDVYQNILLHRVHHDLLVRRNQNLSDKPVYVYLRACHRAGNGRARCPIVV